MGIQLRSRGFLRLRGVGVAAALLAVVGGISPAAGAGPEGATGVYKITGSAKAASAVFTNEPSTGGIPGVVYTDLALSGGIATAVGSTSSERFASLHIVKYRYDEFGEPQFVSQETGEATGGTVSFSLAPRLARASLAATMKLRKCVFAETGFECTVQPNPTTIRVSWTAVAPALYMDYRLSARTRGLKFVETFRGTRRTATVTGTLNGRGLGTLYSASIDDQRARSMLIDHLA